MHGSHSQGNIIFQDIWFPGQNYHFQGQNIQDLNQDMCKKNICSM